MALVEAPDLFEDDLLYGEAGPGHGSLSGSESDDEAAAVPAQAVSPLSKAHMDISGMSFLPFCWHAVASTALTRHSPAAVPNSASHQSSTLRVSLDEEHDGGIPTPSPPIDMAARPIYSRAMAASMPAQRVTARLVSSSSAPCPATAATCFASMAYSCPAGTCIHKGLTWTGWAVVAQCTSQELAAQASAGSPRLHLWWCAPFPATCCPF